MKSSIFPRVRVTSSPQAQQLQNISALQTSLQIQDPYSVSITTQDPINTLQLIANHVPQAGSSITRLSYGSLNLEELFLSLTGRDTRDSDVE